MADQTAQQDRTEAATPRRLQRAREEGRIAVSREVQLFAGLAAVTLVLSWTAGITGHDLTAQLAAFLAYADAESLAGPEGLRLAWIAAWHGAAPVILATLAAGIAAAMLQTGFLLHSSTLQPDLSRISPAAGLRRMFSRDHLMEALKSIAKVALLGFIFWRVLHSDIPALLQSPRWTPAVLLTRTLAPTLHMLFVVLALQAAIAAIDLFWVRLRHAQQLRMSKQDIREEQRETEGDPKIKARIKQIRTHRARKRMLAAVPRATVVVTNPTHYAVALAYDRARNAAPRVVAKGVDSLAARIREVAEANKVPLVANPPLAQALYRVELDTEIPAEHYQAVAEIIAYVWRLGQRAHPAGAPAQRPATPAPRAVRPDLVHHEASQQS
ncbi:MAG TPA: flagellar biosynthesis protein FlhB [Acetobacteraceae bacterium]|nr:flagellar biosynthesis protein FlhB [Acetobacteraceae bacterium]